MNGWMAVGTKTISKLVDGATCSSDGASPMTNPNVCGIRLYVEENNSVAQAVYRKVGLTPSSYALFETDFVLARHNGLMDCPTEA